MTAVAFVPSASPVTTAGRTVGWLVIRQIRRGALIVAVVCASMSSIVAIQYQTTFAGSIDQSGLRALAENPAIRILFGPPIALDDAGGFTVWRTGTPLMVLTSVWILLAATRITRGEEEAGRNDLLLAGRLRMVDLVARCIAAVCGSALLIGLAVGASLVAAGTDATGAIVYALAVLGVTLTSGVAGLLAAQIMPTRAAAVGVTVASLGAGLLTRMLSDGVPALGWMAWATPFGLTARAAPYAENHAAPLIVLAGFPLAFALGALIAARYRDVGSGLVGGATRRAPRTGLLGSVGGFAVRRAIRPTMAWAIGLTTYFLLVGALIASILAFFDKNPMFAKYAGAAGFAGLDSATGFAAVLFSLLAIPTGLYGATRLAAMVADERARRWTPLFSAPVSRMRLVCSEIGVATAGVLVLHVVAGLAMWTGAAITHAPLSMGEALAGALNTVPIAWLGVGAAALATGWAPSVVGAIGALPTAGGFLFDIIVQSMHAPAWVSGISPFAHLAAVPYAAPDWTATVALTIVGAIMASLGVAGFARRDVTT